MVEYRTDDAALLAGRIIASMRAAPGMYASNAETLASFACGVLAMAAFGERNAAEAWILALRDVRGWRKNTEPPWRTLTFDDALPVILAAAERMRIAVPPTGGA